MDTTSSRRSPDGAPEIRMSVAMHPTMLAYDKKLRKELQEIVRALGCDRLADVEERYHTNTHEGILKIAKDADLSRRFLRLHDLTTVLESLRRNPRDTNLLPPDLQREAELRSLFKEAFLGVPEIEKAFTLKDGTSAIDFSDEEKEEARQMLLDKLAEPDITHLIEHLRAHPNEVNDWILVYRPRAQMRSSLEPGAPMTGISVNAMQDVLDEDARKEPNPTRLIYRNSDIEPGEQDWYREVNERGEVHRWASQPLQQGWRFVTRDVVPHTTSKGYDNQTQILAEAAQDLNFPDNAWRRRTPQEVLFDSIVMRKATGKFLLEDTYDRTEQKGVGGRRVYVGGSVADDVGVSILDEYDYVTDDQIGACLSR